MEPVDGYGGDDFRSIEADNTSAFNCRAATGSTHWSNHAYGLAVDVNPIENPYVSGGRSSHGASAPYLDRSRHRAGMAYEGGLLVDAFGSVGWGWGGSWSGGVRDYQHFSYNGR
jgi:D-alanyl-D-alanine carboxypeptidase-like protein